MGEMIHADGFKEFFGACIIFIISHELAHYHYKNTDRKRSEILSGYILDLPSLRSSSYYFRERAISSIKDGGSSQEEMYCDYLATEICWSICVVTRSIDTKLIGVSLSLLFNSLYFFSLRKGIDKKSHYEKLKERHATTLLRLLSLHEYDLKLDNKKIIMDYISGFSASNPPLYDPDYEYFIVFFDVYCLNMSLVLAKKNFYIDEVRYYKVLEDILEVELGAYFPSDMELDNPMDFILYQLRKKALVLFKSKEESTKEREK